MIESAIPVGVIVERRKASSPWIDHTWSVTAIVTGMPETARMTPVGRRGDAERFYLGASELVLASTDTANYRDNLMSGAPKLWVVMHHGPEQSVSLHTVTADPAEGEAHTETATNLVETIAMPEEIAGFVAAFVDEHHVEREFIKRKRDRLDPESLSRRRGGRE